MGIEEKNSYTDFLESSHKVFALVIYDISDSKKRNKLTKLLLGYGFRVQKSAFETVIDKKRYNNLLREIEPFGSEEDSVRIYKIAGKGQVKSFGYVVPDISVEDVIMV